MRFCKSAIALTFLIVSMVPAAVAVPAFTEHQNWAIQESARAGQFYDDGHVYEGSFTFVPTLQAILGQESSYCDDKQHKVGDGWGCGQLLLKTAKMFDAGATAKRLNRDDRYNIWLSATYLAYCRDHVAGSKHAWRDMVRCYHGWDADDWQDYVQDIRDRLQELQVVED